MALPASGPYGPVVHQSTEKHQHPHLGVVPGDHTRHLNKMRLKPAKPTSASGEVQPPDVVRIPNSEDDDWTLVQDSNEMNIPEAILARFGQPGQSVLKFYVNSQEHILDPDLPISLSLAEYLRYHLGLTGTKIGCGEGGCGACTVALRESCEGKDFMLANACMRPVHSMAGMEVITIEHLGTSCQPHPIQKAIAKHSASQCGMCTPGMVMAIYGHLSKTTRSEADNEDTELESCIQGNLCRCTGYRPIYAALHELRDMKLTPNKTSAADQVHRALFAADKKLWFNCVDVEDALTVLKHYSSLPHRLVVGNTSTGVAKYYPPHPNDRPQVYINISTIQEFHKVCSTDVSLDLGAACSISCLIEELQKLEASKPQLKAVLRHIRLVAHPQVRDVGSWAGNIMMAKTHPDFPSDIALLLTLLDAKLTLIDVEGRKREISVEAFLSEGYLAQAAPRVEIVYAVSIPLPKEHAFIDTFKIMRRHMNAHAELNAGVMLVFTGAGAAVVADARLVFGNITHGPFLAQQTSRALIGKELTSKTLSVARRVLEAEIADSIQDASVPDPPFVTVDKAYRQALASNVFFKAGLRAIADRRGRDHLSADEKSAVEYFERPSSMGKQQFSVDDSTAPVGQPVEKYQALEQGCGTAQFTADLPLRKDTLFGIPILAEKIAVVSEIDASLCLQVAGVEGFISAEDILALGLKNEIAGLPYAIFADKSAPTDCIGSFVGLVVGTSFEAARQGAARLQVKYSSAEDPVSISMQQAVDNGQVLEPSNAVMSRTGACNLSEVKTAQGMMTSSGQRHFYLETQTSYVRPDGRGGLEVSTSCQVFDWAQQMLSSTLNLPASKIVIENVRVGGAYGGKAMFYAPPCVAACVAALRTKRPVLVQLDRTSDFLSFGGRCPFEASWSTEFDTTGKILKLSQDVLENAGYNEKGAQKPTSINCYDIPNAKLSSKTVITRTPVNCWMRAPGDFEGSVIMEASVEQIARVLGLDPVLVQERNIVPGMQPVWCALKEQVGYESKLAEVRQFNSSNRYRKRGIYCMGSKYKMTPANYKEKCCVRVHSDGSVELEHSGIEVGQGIDTKAVQACAMEFQQQAADFSMQLVNVVQPKSTSSFSWSGVTGTYGSQTSEAVVSAVVDACKKLGKELEPFRGQGWKDTVDAALESGAKLCQCGETSIAAAAQYDLFNAGCAQVEIDVLTGETQVLAFDIVYDCGKSLNPAVDIGQIEGCIIQALGFSLLEEETRSSVDGRMVNCGTWDYKVPSGLDIPISMNVTLLPASGKAAPVLGSKASGEPAYLAGGATLFAVKDAIGYARDDLGLSRDFRLDPPASPARILASIASS